MLVHGLYAGVRWCYRCIVHVRPDRIARDGIQRPVARADHLPADHHGHPAVAGLVFPGYRHAGHDAGANIRCGDRYRLHYLAEPAVVHGPDTARRADPPGDVIGDCDCARLVQSDAGVPPTDRAEVCCSSKSLLFRQINQILRNSRIVDERQLLSAINCLDSIPYFKYSFLAICNRLVMLFVAS